ncbi:phasin family protein [Sphingomonas sp. ac-8]|uniref:phasin family protein n=1 Tax=Sphingomonas sp. ac-8 TaxID=3242977 RepID=UPI003A80A45F
MAEQTQENAPRDPSTKAGASTGGDGQSAAGPSGAGQSDTGMFGAGTAGATAGMTDGMRAATERMRAAGGQMADQGGELGLKMLDQAEANTREAFRVMREAAKAKDVSEVMRLQSDYLREQGNRSMAQAREIGELIASFGRSTIGQMTGRS